MRPFFPAATLLIVLLVPLLGAGHAAAQDDENAPAGATNVAEPDEITEEQIQALWEMENFVELEALAAQLRETKARFWSGDLQLPVFYTFLSDIALVDTEQFLARVERWRSEHPDSIVAMVAAGSCYSDMGEWSDDDQEGYTAKAYALLQEARKSALRADTVFPEVYPALLYAVAIKEYEPEYGFRDYMAILTGIRNESGVRDSELQEIFLEGQALAPDYDHLYVARAITLLPTWNGIPGEVESFANSVASAHPEMYAHIVREVFDYVDIVEYLLDYSFMWPKIKRGFDLLLQKHPQSTVLRNWYARLAGAHGARAAAATGFETLRGEWDEEIWDDEPTYLRWAAWARGEKPYPYHRQLNDALGEDDNATVKLLLDAGLDPNFTDEDGWPLLSLAAYYGNGTLVDLLLEGGADIALGGESGETPLHGAAYGGELEMVKKLLSINPPKNARNAAGETPLHQGAWSADSPIVALLLEHGADPGTVDDDGYSPLLVSALLGDAETAELLLNAGSNPNLAENEGRTALNIAAASGDVELVRLLLSRGANPTPSAKDGTTPIDEAREAGHDETVLLLEQAIAERSEEERVE